MWFAQRAGEVRDTVVDADDEIDVR